MWLRRVAQVAVASRRRRRCGRRMTTALLITAAAAAAVALCAQLAMSSPVGVAQSASEQDLWLERTAWSQQNDERRRRRRSTSEHKQSSAAAAEAADGAPVRNYGAISHAIGHRNEAPQTLNASNTSNAPAAANDDDESMKFPLYMRILASLACFVIFTCGVCGNLLVPLVVIKTKYLRNSTNLFLINLSVADLLVLTVCMPTVLIELHSRPETWLLGQTMCK